MIDTTRQQLVDSVRAAIAKQTTRDAVLRAAVELIDAYSDGFNWTGVYMLDGDILRVGPYVGPETPHKEIKLDSGICGAAASQKETVLVNDVGSDPRFLACSPFTRSEIVVPLLDGEKVLGEIDIDSNRPSFFTDADQEMLESIAALIVERLKQL
jgi:L-methionine (R)-S-oxide reductase